MAHIIVSLVIVLVLAGNCYAGEYFSCQEMDYFSTEKACPKKQQQLKQPGRNEDSTAGFTKEQIEMWAEPTVDSSGKVVSKLPPLPALRVLADPDNPEYVKQYLEWNQKRSEAIRKAQEAIQAASGIKPPQVINDVKEIKKIDFYFGPT